MMVIINSECEKHMKIDRLIGILSRLLQEEKTMAPEEGLCVQCMHIGPYDDEPATVLKMHEFKHPIRTEEE